MVIEKVYGIQATSLSLSARFTMLAKRGPMQNRRSNRNQLANNRVLKARQQAYNRARLLRQQLVNSGRGLRRYGSETNVSNLRRSNSFGNLSQRSFNSRGRNNFGGNLSRSASFGNLSQFGRQMRMQRGARRGGRMMRGQTRGVVRGKMYRPVQRQTARRGRGGLHRGNRGRGRGRGLMNRTHLAKPLPSREELDQQLDKYMSSTRTALDKDLDEYMKSAMELDEVL